MEPKFKGRTILVVEDQALIALDIAEGFKQAGADVATAATVKEALVLVERDGLCAAVLDHVLIDGNSTRLRQRLKERDVPFVVYSGFAELEDLDGDVPVITKPSAPDVLISTVASLLSRKIKGNPISNGEDG